MMWEYVEETAELTPEQWEKLISLARDVRADIETGRTKAEWITMPTDEQCPHCKIERAKEWRKRYMKPKLLPPSDIDS